MVKRFFIVLFLIFLVIAMLPLITDFKPATELNPLAYKYVKDGPDELGAPNLVTSVVVTYRGLDTLGEVSVLFIATAGIGFLLRKKEKRELKKRKASEILQTGTDFLIPLIFLFGVYIFVHGHLTPGGGFQGGVVIASGVLLMMLSNVSMKFNHLLLISI
jgi:multicomponent Na+:H+ antiporter subunit B